MVVECPTCLGKGRIGVKDESGFAFTTNKCARCDGCGRLIVEEEGEGGFTERPARRPNKK